MSAFTSAADPAHPSSRHPGRPAAIESCGDGVKFGPREGLSSGRDRVQLCPDALPLRQVLAAVGRRVCRRRILRGLMPRAAALAPDQYCVAHAAHSGSNPGPTQRRSQAQTQAAVVSPDSCMKTWRLASPECRSGVPAGICNASRSTGASSGSRSSASWNRELQ